ncbi:hypothetical protein AB4Y40_14110 [Paraburkholderia sp. EG287B]|uniref:hypothetical protein n=1 Tax=Paraburkholderia sp. EG287B TaxID=3237010 RepID=UPI0034D2C22B
MPVELSKLPPEAIPDAKPPRLIVWLLLAVVTIGLGAALVIWLWPKGKSTHVWQFWTWLVVPVFVFALTFIARWHLYEQALAQVEAHNRQRKGVADHNTGFAQRPLALLAHAYLTAMGERDVGKRILQGDSLLCYQPVRGIGASVSHTAIVSQRGDDRETEKRRTRRNALPLTDDDLLDLFGRLIGGMQATLGTLPPQLVLPVRLIVAGNEYPLDVARQWETAWYAFGLGQFVFSDSAAGAGMMALDAWLDEADRGKRDRVELRVNVQFRDDPPDNGAEAATAMLIAWPDIADRLGLPVQAWLHRPVCALAERSGLALDTALTWGTVTSAEDTVVWSSGLAVDGRECLARAFKQSPSKSTESVGDSDGVAAANIDMSLGDAGHAAGWLACALAAENFTGTERAQLIATQEPSGVVYAVVRKPSRQQPENPQ